MLKSKGIIVRAFQLIAVVAISVVASYIFQLSHTAIQMNGVFVYCYVAYAMTIVLSYVCISHYSKYLAFSISFALLALVVFGPSQKVIELFPVYAPFLAASMGVFSVLVVPGAKGRGFFGFLFVLILPVVLAQSRVGGHLLLTLEGSIASYEVHALTIAVIGGCFYLRYMISANIMHHEFMSRGGSEEDIGAVCWWNTLIVAVVVAGSIATAILLPLATPILANIFQPYLAGVPLFILVLGLGMGVVVTMIYALQKSAGE